MNSNAGLPSAAECAEVLDQSQRAEPFIPLNVTLQMRDACIALTGLWCCARPSTQGFALGYVV
jgi:hypothetical protein